MAKETFNPHDWYWTVNGDTSRVFSSAVGEFVATNDAAYLAWTADGTPPTRIANTAELGEVLAPYRIRPGNAQVLDGYKEEHSRKLTVELAAKILLWCVNEIRALKGQSSLSAAQFRAFLKDQV